MSLNILGLKSSKGTKRVFNISWWKVIVGALLIIVGIIGIKIYFTDNTNMLAGAMMAFGLAGGGIMVWWGFSKFSNAFLFYTGSKPREATGRENAIILYARKGDNNRDIPVMIKVSELTNIPKGARLHYVKNWRRHFYELYNDTNDKKLKAVLIPDKTAFPPELYKIPATMQQFKDYMEYSPPTMFQKIAPAILILAMVVVGILQVITLGD